MSRFLAVILMAGAVAVPAHAEDLDINIGDNSLRVALAGAFPTERTANAFYDVGFTFSDERKQDLKHIHGGLLVTGDAGARDANVLAGLGARLFYSDLRAGNGGGLALGGQFDVRLPDFNRLGLIGYGYFAPRVTTFSDIDRYTEWAAAVDYQVIRDASVYLGFRQIRFKLDDGLSGRADSGFHLGLRLTF